MWFHLRVDVASKEQYEPNNQPTRNSLADTENGLRVSRREWGARRTGEALRKHNWWPRQSQAGRLGTGKTVNNIAVTVCGARRVLDLQGERFANCMNVSPLRGAPETNTEQYWMSTVIGKNEKRK